ncbi:glycine-rich domain-containing protein [Streptomyces sp. NPDC058289]|uniref:glycine-rich domain-containing protein n=1 Tax=Streptomyces sp. NPDC058289 TaxID=3346425 RepID=UPI0036ED8237
MAALNTPYRILVCASCRAPPPRCCPSPCFPPLRPRPRPRSRPAPPSKVFHNDGDHTYVLPLRKNVKTLQVVAIGGGGGGGGGRGAWRNFGAGGGSGAGGTTVSCDINNYQGDPQLPVTKLTVHVGKGGGGGQDANSGDYTTVSFPSSGAWTRSSTWRRSARAAAGPGRGWRSPSPPRRPWAGRSAGACLGRRWCTWPASSGTSTRRWTCCRRNTRASGSRPEPMGGPSPTAGRRGTCADATSPGGVPGLFVVGNGEALVFRPGGFEQTSPGRDQRAPSQ